MTRFLADYRGLATVRLSQMRSFRNGSSGFSFLGDWLAGRSGLLCRDSCCSVAWIRELCQARLEVPAAAAVGLSFCSTRQSDRQTDATGPRDGSWSRLECLGAAFESGRQRRDCDPRDHFVGWWLGWFGVSRRTARCGRFWSSGCVFGLVLWVALSANQ